MNGAMPSGPSALIAARMSPVAAPRPQYGTRASASAGPLERCPAAGTARPCRSRSAPPSPAAPAAPARPSRAPSPAMNTRGDGEILGAEEDPREADEVEHDQPSTTILPARLSGRWPSHGSAHPLDRKPAAMQRAPHHEFPRRAVPDAAEQHRDHQVAVGVEPAVPVAAERLVEVVAQPGRLSEMCQRCQNSRSRCAR